LKLALTIHGRQSVCIEERFTLEINYEYNELLNIKIRSVYSTELKSTKISLKLNV